MTTPTTNPYQTTITTNANVAEKIVAPLIPLRRTRRKYKKVDYTGMDTIEPLNEYDGLTNIWADETIYSDPDYIPEPIYRDRNNLSPILKHLLSTDDIMYRDVDGEFKFLTTEERLTEIRKECARSLQLDNTYYILNNLLSTAPLVHKNHGDEEEKLLTDEQRLQLIRDEIKGLLDIRKLGSTILYPKA